MMTRQIYNARSRIRGPTSALTNFLRERGIRPRNLNYRNPPAQPQPPPPPPPPPAASLDDGAENDGSGLPGADPDDNNDPQIESSAAASRRRSTRLSSNTTATSTNGTVTLQYTARRAATTAATAAAAAATAATATRKRKKREASSDSDDNFLPINSATTPRANRSRAGRTRVEFCSLCRCRFTVGAEKAGGAEKENLVCPACAKGDGEAKKKVQRRRRGKGERMAGEDGFIPVPSLQDVCIKLIARYIEDVEALGDIGEINMDKICKIICKNRQLNNHVARLFLNPLETQMSFYDCTGLDTIGFFNIAQFCPNLHTLKLNFCGRLSDAVTDKYASHLHHLRSLTLSGPFLVTAPAWGRLFTALGARLEYLTLEHSPRLDLPTLDILVTSCPNLRELRLMRVAKLDDEWLPHIARLTKLETLDISHPGGSITSGPLISLLEARGSGLRELGLHGCAGLTDEALTEGVLPTCVRLQTLCIAECETLSSSAAAKLFTEWRTNGLNPGLVCVDIARCTLFKDEVLEALAKHSARTLRELSVNSLEELTAKGFEALAGEKGAEPCVELREVDAGFCRAVDDEVVGKLMKGCAMLSVLRVWGNHKVTECAYRRKGVQLIGRQCDTL
ncbi:hypothetical protein BC937DRAFT_95449 [Endogone sp. FLAS-F59071]|nr:hypothetical protein BC937DRAFT_95449 [Endogone sp. FLAS-F59071]|eukprot:RUS22885.1 hypothetical protein BC937DRAFT_95449 [Endogone sp. FLAS-F59071]